jgi:LysR family hydrogen peroxide-inducible transcriptional activator
MDEKNIVQGEFKLGIIPSVADCLIPLFLHKFTNKFPNVELTLIELKTNEIIEMLKRDEIDAGIAATPLLEKELKEEPLYWEPFYLFVNKLHELFPKKSIEQNDLLKQNILLMSEGNCMRVQVGQICKLKETFADKKTNVHFESGNFQTLIQLVKQNMGITLLPHLATISIDANKDMIKPFKGKIPVREIGIITKRALVKKTISDALAEIIKEVVPLELQTRNKEKSKIISPLT